jgi:hypothetical protein
MIKPLLLSLSLLVAGCAATAQWSHPAKTEAQFAADQERCEVEAKVHVQRHHKPGSNIDLQGLARIFEIMEQRSLDSQYNAELRRYVSDCLQTQGWVLK